MNSRYRYVVLVAITTTLVFLLCNTMTGQVPAATVTAVDSKTGVAAGKINSSGQQFQFTLNNRAQLPQLRVGQGVYVNFKTRQVSLDGRTIAGSIVSSGPSAAVAPDGSGNSAGNAKPSTALSPKPDTPAVPNAPPPSGAAALGVILQSVKLTPSQVIGGAVVNGTVQMSGPVPQTVVIQLTVSANPYIEKASLSLNQVTLVAGDVSAPFTLTTTPLTQAGDEPFVSATDVSVTATPPQKYGTAQQAKVTVEAPSLTSLVVLSPQIGGMNTGFLLKINGPAGKGDYLVNAATDRADLAQVPAHWSVPEGKDFVAGHIVTKSVPASTSLKISASQGGKTLESTLVLTPPGLAHVICTPSSITGGASGECEAGLNAPIVSGPANVTLSSNKPDVLSVPANVTINLNQKKATFPFKTIAAGASGQAGTTVRVSGTYSGTTWYSDVTVVQLPLLTSLNLAPSSIVVGQDSIARVQINTPATGNGVDVKLSSGNGEIASTAGVAHVPTGGVQGDGVVTTKHGFGDVDVLITATLGGVNQTSTLHVYRPPLFESMYFTPNEVALPSGQTAAHLHLKFSGTVHTGEPPTVAITWSEPWGGATSTPIDTPVQPNMQYSITVKPCPGNGSCEMVVKATYAGQTKSATLKIYP